MDKIKYTLIIPAAGSGKRMGSNIPKQFIEINGKTILEHTVSAFCNSNHYPSELIISTSQENIEFIHNIFNGKINNYSVVLGGSSRQESVYNALKQSKNDYVLIHDSVRPFISKNLIIKTIENLLEKDAVIPVVAVKDTIKEIKNGFVQNTPNRSVLFAAQTPQAFKTNLAVKANEFLKGNYEGLTDDASIIENYGSKVFTVEGEYENIKITTKDDLDIAKRLL